MGENNRTFQTALGLITIEKLKKLPIYVKINKTYLYNGILLNRKRNKSYINQSVNLKNVS